MECSKCWWWNINEISCKTSTWTFSIFNYWFLLSKQFINSHLIWRMLGIYLWMWFFHLLQGNQCNEKKKQLDGILLQLDILCRTHFVSIWCINHGKSMVMRWNVMLKNHTIRYTLTNEFILCRNIVFIYLYVNRSDDVGNVVNMI